MTSNHTYRGTLTFRIDSRCFQTNRGTSVSLFQHFKIVLPVGIITHLDQKLNTAIKKIPIKDITTVNSVLNTQSNKTNYYNEHTSQGVEVMFGERYVYDLLVILCNLIIFKLV
jgi:hypothetical protein